MCPCCHNPTQQPLWLCSSCLLWQHLKTPSQVETTLPGVKSGEPTGLSWQAPQHMAAVNNRSSLSSLGLPHISPAGEGSLTDCWPPSPHAHKNRHRGQGNNQSPRAGPDCGLPHLSTHPSTRHTPHHTSFVPAAGKQHPLASSLQARDRPAPRHA